VSLRRIDARFLLPHPVRRAAVLPGADGWRTELERAEIAVVDGGAADRLDLVVAPAERSREALSLRPRALILEGSTRRISTGKLERRSYLPLPSHTEPLVYVPLGGSRAARYAAAHWAFAGSHRKRLRNRLLGQLAARDLLPALRPLVTVAAAQSVPPFLVRAAREHEVPEAAAALLLAGQGDDYSRAVFLLFEPARAEPSWALKFGRLSIPLASFEREERGLALAESAGGVVAAHAPRHLAGFEAAGLRCSLETAASGRPLLAFLHASHGRRRRERAAERVCDWLVEVARSTRAASETLRPEQRRLALEVLPRWNLPAELADGVASIPAVLQHNDVGSWNVIVKGDEFTIVDWEDAVDHGLPLWDLLYFLADAIAHLDGARARDARPGHFERLFLGELPSSALLFRWTRRMVDALGLPAESVGRLATLCWLHHGLAGERRAAAAPGPPPERDVPHESLKRMAERWLSHPGLGVDWRRWQEE
jgi:phosphotransferase family enzyme